VIAAETAVMAAVAVTARADKDVGKENLGDNNVGMAADNNVGDDDGWVNSGRWFNSPLLSPGQKTFPVDITVLSLCVWDKIILSRRLIA
jgi:hypothetical protein